MFSTNYSSSGILISATCRKVEANQSSWKTNLSGIGVSTSLLKAEEGGALALEHLGAIMSALHQGGDLPALTGEEARVLALIIGSSSEGSTMIAGPEIKLPLPFTLNIARDIKES